MTPDRKNKLTPEEILEAIEEADAQAEAERILALSDEALDRELADAGFDPEAVRKRGREIGERVTGGSRDATHGAGGDPDSGDGGAWVSEPPPKRGTAPEPRWLWLAAAALVAATVGGGAIYAASMAKTEKVAAKPDGGATPADAGMSATEMARAIRETAFKACEGKRWVECGDGLAKARDLDPDGDADSRVQAAWKAMVDGLRAPSPVNDKSMRPKP
jgi:hypothetical protein